MWIVTVLAVLVLFFSFLGGLREGAVKSFFSVLSLIIALPVTSAFFHIIASLLSFLPGQDWENFLGFFVTLAIVTAILHLIFWLPRRLLGKILDVGCLSNIIGACINLFSAAIGLTVLSLVLIAFPVWGWLAEAIRNSSVLVWLISHLVFVQYLLPAIIPAIPKSEAVI